jgi:hypothetical protein
VKASKSLVLIPYVSEQSQYPGLKLDLGRWCESLVIPVMGNTYDAVEDLYNKDFPSYEWDKFLELLHLAICSETIERLALETTCRSNGRSLYHFVYQDYKDLLQYQKEIEDLRSSLQTERDSDSREQTFYELLRNRDHNLIKQLSFCTFVIP